ncbi:MAG: SDR family NAD(P)-dependent oxidoreductase [Oscillospiraceae bacterium]|nr:SDR family NAD(P)-dependent oxidoreductase [Oscillospiraceae bacterium]
MKSILITGAAGGMGCAAAALFASRGWRVFAVDKLPVKARENVVPVQADLTDEKSVAASFDTIRAQTDALDAVVHLAGTYLLDSLVEIAPRDFERAFRVNLGAAFLVNRTFLPLLCAGARIVTVTSELAVRGPLPFTGLYAVTKTALDKYAYSLRMELQLSGIDVSVLRAGAVDTGMIGESTRQLDEFCRGTARYACNAKRFRAIVDRVEARRIPPEKLAEKLFRIVTAKRPKFAYAINRNPLLILLDLLPPRARFAMIRRVLKE